MKRGLAIWFRSGAPWIWLNAGAVAVCLAMVIGLLLLLGVRGLGHFWPKPVLQASYAAMDPPLTVVGEIANTETVDAAQLRFFAAGLPLAGATIERQLLKLGNRDITGNDFAWVLPEFFIEVNYPEQLVTLERREWGNFYGYLTGILQDGASAAPRGTEADAADVLWSELHRRLDRARQLRQEIEQIERTIIADINFGMERLRLQERRLQLAGGDSPENSRQIDRQREMLDTQYAEIRLRLLELNRQMQRDSAIFRIADGSTAEIPVADIVRAYRPNAMNWFEAMGVYLARLLEFLTEDPRESNTEGGLLPAIYGTAMMVLLMSVIVTPLGVLAAVYLSEYAPRGWLTRIIRISVNNLAGVPSIVYGMFGLGFFIYLAGGEIDRLFFAESLPAPTFGTPGLLWASLTLALLTLPVVIVATEEGLANIPATLREGSLALGATKFETLWQVILPLARPSMLTGLILAVARAAGEVAPLMLVGVVKLAPSLPLDTEFPYLHLEQQFMHLGYYVFDLAMQSPNVEAAMPQAFATAFLLVAVVTGLNLSAVILRGRLRERYRAMDTGSWS